MNTHDDDMRARFQGLLTDEPASSLSIDAIERQGRARRRRHVAGRAAVVLTTTAVVAGGVMLALPGDRPADDFAGTPTGIATGSPTASSTTQSTEDRAGAWNAANVRDLEGITGLTAIASEVTDAEDDYIRSWIHLRDAQGRGIDVVVAIARAGAIQQRSLSPSAIREQCEANSVECLVLDQGIPEGMVGTWLEAMITTEQGRGFAEHYWMNEDDYASVIFTPVGVEDTQEVVATEALGRWLYRDFTRPWVP